MDKRYQVFVSSTYEDLQEERRTVIQALLETDCIPSGMELFPASNEDQWSLIKDIIDDCDYYLLIIGGRYGSTNEKGMSYTEMEYRYALETNKPIISFLHKNPDSIPSGKTEKKDVGKKRLAAFRQLAQQKMVRYWTNPDDLDAAVTKGIIHLKKKFPAIGWVKADSATDEKSVREILRLQQENERLKNELNMQKTSAPKGTEALAQGDDTITVKFEWSCLSLKNGHRTKFKGSTILTWNSIYKYISPFLINEYKDSYLRNRIEDFIIKSYQDTFTTICNSERLKESTFQKDIPVEEFQRIKVQFIALGLITKSIKSRSVKDTGSYWTLTEYGDYVMTQLIAERKEEPE